MVKATCEACGNPDAEVTGAYVHCQCGYVGTYNASLPFKPGKPGAYVCRCDAATGVSGCACPPEMKENAPAVKLTCEACGAATNLDGCCGVCGFGYGGNADKS